MPTRPGSLPSERPPSRYPPLQHPRLLRRHTSLSPQRSLSRRRLGASRLIPPPLQQGTLEGRRPPPSAKLSSQTKILEVCQKGQVFAILRLQYLPSANPLWSEFWSTYYRHIETNIEMREVGERRNQPSEGCRRKLIRPRHHLSANVNGEDLKFGEGEARREWDSIE